MSSCGMRSATVPLVSPRSHISDDWALKTSVSGPGQNSRIRSRAQAGTSVASPSTVRTLGTSTGGGISRPRPLAASSEAHRLGGEGVGTDAVDRVGRQDDDLAGADRLDGLGHAVATPLVGAAVVDGAHGVSLALQPPHPSLCAIQRTRTRRIAQRLGEEYHGSGCGGASTWARKLRRQIPTVRQQFATATHC